jgi:phenylalanyl-tRNA synthetase alpha chain
MSEPFNLATLLKRIDGAASLEALDELRVQILGKQGALSQEMRTLGKLPPEERRTRGQELNILKGHVEKHLSSRKKILEKEALRKRLFEEKVDVTAPLATELYDVGRIHPVSFALFEVEKIFTQMGFHVAKGPEIETAYYNFTALNVPDNHPVRYDQDTFYLKPLKDDPNLSGEQTPLLRTHTSPVQIRALEKQSPPVRVIAPGRVFRSDCDATHTPMFHQIEGLVIEEGIHMGHLKGCLEEFFRLFFGQPIPLRFRPSFFPFTEPSAEVDILCRRTKETIHVGEGDEWLEILGCGMVHSHVLSHVNLEPDNHQGFAFGMGIERLAMLKYRIHDLRHFFNNDLGWLQYFGQNPSSMLYPLATRS